MNELWKKVLEGLITQHKKKSFEQTNSGELKEWKFKCAEREEYKENKS